MTIDNSKLSKVQRLRQLSDLLDNAIPIPGTSLRFGLDPILGLFPGVGDFLTTAVSAYIVVEAAKMGISRNILLQMVVNIILDMVVGTVPVVGDVADVAWKANTKNIGLLEEHFKVSQSSEKTDWWFLAWILGGLIVFAMIVGAIAVTILRGLLSLIHG
ncbi:MAG TPA: DUF4112 domain-containing protein [Cyanobacteria bacterium UBA11149]|nr:DUF4112 domain-containing protein [Cyanobacteria bacterium UBA11367]HBE58892.1 DUF4112 domain-containing protein [Cyanobacteria bacterium UBA11366]HBK65423.1 DUF4112 domain-containing protein [Cyanobacteria bacterium UBA11166]HBR73536.1 DUF4112 domain-containing protein [Cyanobacteria bacterium UBA11159]HBS69578.1 DUF4112 domain-containing protein [Cyanobacteria bacterium UBA11153]HBW92234.1 DUF4112 domain-containing protein [Cyanobacteria bacterium UBA11149]HCA93980.1 DUF4112 domain-conta